VEGLPVSGGSQLYLSAIETVHFGVTIGVSKLIQANNGSVMKKIRLACLFAIGILGAFSVPAQSIDSYYSYDLYSAQEPSFDFLGFYGSRDKGGSDTGVAGPGLGFNYFITQNIGVGVDTYADAFTWPYLLNTSGIIRYPIPRTAIAPYAFGGFGREWWHAPQWLGYFGGGVEYRLAPARMKIPLGLFADVRGVFPGETKDYAVVRFGLRFKLK
jgi:hypothetical protein